MMYFAKKDTFSIPGKHITPAYPLTTCPFHTPAYQQPPPQKNAPPPHTSQLNNHHAKTTPTIKTPFPYQYQCPLGGRIDDHGPPQCQWTSPVSKTTTLKQQYESHVPPSPPQQPVQQSMTWLTNSRKHRTRKRDWSQLQNSVPALYHTFCVKTSWSSIGLLGCLSNQSRIQTSNSARYQCTVISILVTSISTVSPSPFLLR